MKHSRMTAAELTSLLVDYFGTDQWREGIDLYGAQGVADTWHVDMPTARRAISMARTILREERGIFLPIAHWSNDFLLAPTTDPIEAYRGELPQLRDLNTRAERTYDRVSYVLRRLETIRPARAGQQERAIRTAFDAFDAALENANGWISDQIEMRSHA